MWGVRTAPSRECLFAVEQPEGAGFGGSDVGPEKVVHVFWLGGMTCDGCTVATTGATSPSLDTLELGHNPDFPKVVLHHPMFSERVGDEFMAPFRQAADGSLGAPYVIVLEGSVPDDQAMRDGDGYFSAMGAGGLNGGSGSDQPNRMTDWLLKLAPGASACVAIGTCATWGGIPAAAGNITGSMGLMDFLGKEYRSASDVPVVNVPGCAPQGDNFTETLTNVLLHVQGMGPLPEFDELGRPVWLFGETVHHHCPKAGYYEEGTFAEAFGDNECLVEIGCWGPVVQCNITERGAINHMGGCMVAGGACIGCTMPGFPDKFSPFYKAPPGSAVSGGMSRTTGAAIRRLRRLSMGNLNREPLWDQIGDIPSGWAVAKSERTGGQKASSFFYKKLQYSDSPNHGKRYKKQPIPETMNIFTQEADERRGKTTTAHRYAPPDPHKEEGAKKEEGPETRR